MLTPDLSLNPGVGAQTLPGTAGALSFEMMAGGNSASSATRRESTSYATIPRTLVISHQRKGANYGEVITSLVKYKYVNQAVDASLTGGIAPSFTVNLTITRPVKSGGDVTVAKMKDGVGFVLAAILGSGNLDRILAEQS